ncbi:Sensory box histidine kinase [Desulfosporosinus metallidurans]|uniref:histidine kinase n=2 Tax=Desulfosporosinus metallidurans TaxID=1888891 RepID=A0A1Q8QEX5_9FIRM|nr:Sensory box histidine kinase [Desulfosporosinus metallidurans]
MFRRQAYYYASAAFLVMWFVYTVAVIKQPYVGVELENVNGQWIVTYSDTQGEGYESGVRVGDLIIKINNDVPDKYRSVQIWSEAEGASTIEVRRVDQPNVQIINIPKHPVLQTELSEIPMVIQGLVFWILGFMAWFRRPFLLQARALFWLNWFIGLAIVLAPASSRDLLLARELEYIIFSAVPIFLIDFVATFPDVKINQAKQLCRLMLILMTVIILTLTVLQSAGIVHFFSQLRKLVLVTVSIGVLLTLWNLGTLLKLPKDKPNKNKVNILLMGMAIGFLPFVLLTAVPIIVGFQPILNAHVSSLFVSVIPATWYYAIVNKYLPDSRRLLGTIISYFVAGVIISFIVSYLQFLKLSSAFNLALYLSTVTIFFVFIVCFTLIRVMLNKLFDKYLLPEGKKAIKKRILELNESLSMINEENRMLEEVVKSLAIEGIFIALEDAKGGYLKKAVGRFLENQIEQAELEEFFQADPRISLDAQMLPDDFPAEIYIPFVSNEFTCGIFLGHHYSYVKIELDELPLITLISSQLAQRLITTFVIKELSKEIKDLAQRSLASQRRKQGLIGINTALFRSIEKERKSIACEIHDGPLQLGLDLNRWLKYLVEECLTNDDVKTKMAISHMREVVEDLNFELRLICNDLRPPSLTDLGLLSAIELMCEEMMLKELLLISLETVGINREERFKEDIELAAYRFLQEGITNAVKHSGTNELKIHIEINESKIELSVIDAGKGFDTSQIEDCSLTSSHFGIVGMKERLENLDGILQISSSIGQGTMLKASIPIV